MATPSDSIIFADLRGDRFATVKSSRISTARSGHTATVLPDGNVMVFGGQGENGKSLASAEVIGTETGKVLVLEDPGLFPRKYHTATLLTNGLVLIAGGTADDGTPIAESELWNPQSRTVDPFIASLNAPRTHHQAALLANGKGLVWGGENGSGEAAEQGEIYEPAEKIFKAVEWWDDTALAGPSESLVVAETLPAPDAKDVPVQARVAVRFSQRIDVRSVNAANVSLLGPAGLVPGKAVAAEEGRLAFFSPSAELWPASTYTLFLKGVVGAAGDKLPFSAFSFTTRALKEEGKGSIESISVPTSDGLGAGTTAAKGSLLGVTSALRHDKKALTRDKDEKAKEKEEPEENEEEDWIPGPENLRGNWRMIGAGRSPGMKLFSESTPLLSAPAGTTAITGRILKLNGRPLRGVVVGLGGVSTTTDVAGRFLLAGVPNGLQQLMVNGEGVNSRGRSYGRHYIRVDIAAGKTTRLARDVYLSRINPAHTISIASPTDREVVLTHPLIPDMEIHIPKGTVIRDADGKIVTKISITPVPIDRAPADVPEGFPVFFTLQPAGAVLENKNPAALRAARVLYPNYLSLPAGQSVDFWNYDPKVRGWYVYGTGKVTPDGKQVQPDAGVGEYVIMPFGYTVGGSSQPPPEGPPPGGCAMAGDPVDCATGLFLHGATDFYIPDAIPITLTRIYRQKDTLVSREFGIGTNHSLAMYLHNPGGSSNANEIDIILPDGGRIQYFLVSGSGINVGSVWRHTNSPTAFNNSEMRINDAAHRFEVTLRDKTVLTFGNHAPNLLVGVRDPNGNSLTITRSGDNDGPISRVTSPNGRYLDFVYDAAKRITKVTDNIGRNVNYEYDTSGRLWKVTDQDGKVEQYGYDTSHRLTTVTDRRGNPMVTNVYDANGRVSQQTLADGAIWKFAYTLSAGKVTQTQVTDPRNSIRQIKFNAAGYITQEIRGLGTTEQQTYAYQRNARNMVTSVTDQLSRKTVMSYDNAGRMVGITRLHGTVDAVTDTFTYEPNFGKLATYTDPLNHTTRLGYDSLGNLVSVTDALNKSVTMTLNGQGLPTAITNALGRRTQVTYQQGDVASVIDPLSRKIDMFSDSVGRLMSMVDPLANRTQYSYDALDRTLQVTDATGGITAMTYDPNGNLLTVRDPRNLAAHAYRYDSRDRMDRYTDPLGRSETYLYDGMGNLQTYTNRKSQVTSYTYDSLNRIKVITFQDGKTITPTWDAGNRLTKLVDSLNGTITRQYDLLDRLKQEVTPQGQVDYEYDKAGRRTKMTVAGGTPIIYAYDDANRLTSQTQGTAVVGFTYDNGDRRTKLTLPNGVTTTYGYSNADELTSIAWAKAGTALGNVTYTYDTAGRRTGRVSTIDESGLPAAVASATYNAANQLTQWGAQTLTYDLNGNLTNDGAKTYAWNARNQLTSITGGNTFTYDAFGRRRTVTAASVTTGYQYDGRNLVRELNGTTQTASYLTGVGLDEVFSRTDSAGTSNYLVDGLNSVVGLTDSAGVKQTSYAYDAYGNTAASGTASGNKLQYTGREKDETGLYYMRARYYSPGLQRFISEDPIGLAGGINANAYVGGDPVGLSDPTGECPMCVGVAVGAGMDIAFQLLLNGGDVGCIDWAQVAASAALGAIGGGASDALKALRLIRSVKATTKGPVIIGETMARVEAAAAKYPGAKILNDMPDFKAMGMNKDQVTSAMMQYNRQWILAQMRSGRQIIDIGVDVNRNTSSIFYQMEQSMLKNYKKIHPELNGAALP